MSDRLALFVVMGDRLATINMGRKGVGCTLSGRTPPTVDVVVFARWRQCAFEDKGVH